MDTYTRISPIYREDILEKPQMMSIVTGRVCARIRIDDIEYVEQDYRQLHIVTADADYVVYESIKTVLEILKDRGEFYRALKTFVVNFNHIKTVEDIYVCFESGRKFAMGRNNICKTRNEFRKYLQRYRFYTNNIGENKVAESFKKS